MAHVDTYQLVTDRITTALEAGTVPWHRPWNPSGGMPRNLVSGKLYRGINPLLLSLGSAYQSPWWCTFNQARERGGCVRKGEKGSLVIFWKLPTRQEVDGADADTPEYERRAPLLKHYWVFNSEQCDGLTTPPTEEYQPNEWDPIPLCESIVAGMPQRPATKTDSRQAFYCPALDYVGMPLLSQFESPEAYYATYFHELVHSTGHPRRLDRSLSLEVQPFGSPDYSKEELVAEFGAAYLCGVAGIWPAVTSNSAAYIAGWLSKLRGDKKLLVMAAAQAQKAADFILAVQHDAE